MWWTMEGLANAIKDMQQHFAVHGKKCYSDILTICALKHKIPPSSLYSYTRADLSRRRSTSRGRGRPCIVDNHTLDDLLKRYAPKRYKSKDVKGEILSRQPDLEAVQVKNFLRTFKRKVMEYRTAMGIDIEGWIMWEYNFLLLFYFVCYHCSSAESFIILFIFAVDWNGISIQSSLPRIVESNRKIRLFNPYSYECGWQRSLWVLYLISS